MSKLKMNCGYCGRKCDLDKDFCIPQDSVYVCKSCYTWQRKVSDLYAEVEKVEQHYVKQREYYTKEFNEIIDNLKQQLAEKEKEIETIKKDSDKNIDYLVEFASLIESEKDCNRMLKALDRVKSGNKYIIDKDYNQDKIELLEKVKEYFVEEDEDGDGIKTGDWTITKDACEVAEYIDTLIKEIKGE